MLWCSPPGEFAEYFDFDRRAKNSARIQDQELELNGGKKFTEGRMHLDVGCISVGKCLNLFWWSCG